ncbi:hypothetical protein PpBr36_03270 [Pyricularia pennisetigena]|uniref:hypothetical protein n=1 Tax=Pyricularia pennisetigena TaxID=1578925 RepID=UPI0011522B22|nr:hypothetical protein PpBr36_03270 [Pyricularia pennisetigena]TLS30125.1 hypothetical protein PpBr36_03270 [Pyricularia pennisetigena]
MDRIAFNIIFRPSMDKTGLTCLHLACQECHFEVAQLLIKKGTDVKVANEDKETPLHLASYKGHFRMTQLLIEKGADVAGAGEYGKTPLHLASQQGHFEVSRLLIEKGKTHLLQLETNMDGRRCIWPMRKATTEQLNC